MEPQAIKFQYIHLMLQQKNPSLVFKHSLNSLDPVTSIGSELFKQQHIQELYIQLNSFFVSKEFVAHVFL